MAIVSEDLVNFVRRVVALIERYDLPVALLNQLYLSTT